MQCAAPCPFWAPPWSARRAFAQDAYPAKPVKFIVNFPPGGPADLIARTLASELQKSLKPADLKPVMVITSSGLLVGVESSRSPA